MADTTEIENALRAKAEEMGVDPDFASSVGWQESRFNPQARSPKGAGGVMQVMPATAKDLAPRFGDDNIAQGVGFLKDQLDTFADIPDERDRQFFALAAYNWGPNAVFGAMEKAKAGGKDPSQFVSIYESLPEETAGYIANIYERYQGIKAQSQPQPSPTPVEPPTATPQPDPSAMDIIEQPGAKTLSPVPWTSALRDTLGRQGESVGAGAMGLLKGLVTGQLTNPSYYTQGEGMENIEAMGPVIAGPVGAATGVAAETAARARPDLSPVSPETAATIGQVGPGVAQLGLSGLRGAARLASPALVKSEAQAGALGARSAEQALANEARAGELAAREAAGAEVPQVVENIGQRLTGQQVQSAKALRELESTKPTGLVGPSGEALGKTEAQWSKELTNLRKVDENLGKAVTDFDKHVRRTLAKTEPKAIAETLAKPEVGEALLAHATPAEASLIQRAIDAGKPLTEAIKDLTPGELAALNAEVGRGRGILGALVSGVVRHGVTGGVTALTGGWGTIPTYLGMKALDATLGTKPMVKTLLALKKVSAGKPEAAALFSRISAKVGGPQTLAPLTAQEPDGPTMVASVEEP